MTVNRMHEAESEVDAKKPPNPSPDEALWSLSLKNPLESSEHPQNLLIPDFIQRWEHLALVRCVSIKGRSLCISSSSRDCGCFQQEISRLSLGFDMSDSETLTANEALRQLQWLSPDEAKSTPPLLGTSVMEVGQLTAYPFLCHYKNWFDSVDKGERGWKWNAHFLDRQCQRCCLQSINVRMFLVQANTW